MRSALWVRLAALLVAVGGIWVALTQQQPPADLTVEKLADDLYVLVGSGGNVAVYTTDQGAILVDDKFEPNYPQIVAKVKSVTDKPVRYLLNTHHHGDHTGGNAKMMGASVEILAHENARANLIKNNMPGLPAIGYADQAFVTLGGKTVQARHFYAGHTNGDSVIYFPAHKIVHTGDLFVRGAPFIDYANGGSSDAWMKSIDGILTLDFDTVIPGHGAISKRADLIKWKADFETARSRMRELSRQGKSRDDAVSLFKVDDLAGWTTSGFARNAPRFYDEMRAP